MLLELSIPLYIMRKQFHGFINKLVLFLSHPHKSSNTPANRSLLFSNPFEFAEKTAMESNVPIIWTNEKHVQFLNTMEASFVCSMIENKGRLSTRLDRYIPDTADSTLDLIKTPHTTKKSGPVRKMDGGAVRRTRRLTSQPFISAQLDQVVPQFQIAIVGDKVL